MQLQRYPYLKNNPLQAWDSADDLLLAHLSTLDQTGKRVLVVNDSFGALTCALEPCDSYSDSYLTHRAVALNSGGTRTTLSRLEALQGPYDLVVLRVPKSMAFLDDILCQLSQHVAPGTPLVCGAMVKHLAPAAFGLIQARFGPTTTSLAQKKARLIFAHFEREPSVSPYPSAVALDGFASPFTHHANVFSREKLDIGTRFFLEHVPVGPFTQILDLGCANGVVGICAKQHNPSAQITFTDESQQALLSAQASYAAFFEDPATFLWTHSHEDGPPDTFDLVLCNPPFHQQHTIGDSVAWQMFSDAKRVLRPGGLVRIVGNSHLGYHHKLKRLFGKSRIVATNEKFMIVEAQK